MLPQKIYTQKQNNLMESSSSFSARSKTSSTELEDWPAKISKTKVNGKKLKTHIVEADRRQQDTQKKSILFLESLLPEDFGNRLSLRLLSRDPQRRNPTKNINIFVLYICLRTRLCLTIVTISFNCLFRSSNRNLLTSSSNEYHLSENSSLKRDPNVCKDRSS